jgi:hypothetical protein
MAKTACALLLVAIGCCTVAVAQPPPPPPPLAIAPPTMLAPPVEIGLLAAAQSRIGALGLMTVGRELTPDEQAQIQDAQEVTELLGVPGRNFLGPISELARQRGVFQEAIRALARGNYRQASLGLAHCLVSFPNAKILYRELAEIFLKRDDAVAAAGFCASGIGVIPPEDDTFVSLIKMSLATWEFEDDKIPQTLPDSPQSRTSIATLSRTRAGLSMAGHDTLADEVRVDIEKWLEGDNEYPALAAAVVVELTLAAAQALLEGEDFAGRSELVESLHLAGVAACDGKWEDCLQYLMSGKEQTDQEQVTKLLDLTIPVTISGFSPRHQLPPEVREVAEKMTDFPVLQALLVYPRD